MADLSKNTRTLTRRQLRNVVYDCCPTLSRAAAGEVFNIVFDEIATALANGEDVKLREFGVFVVREKRARNGRNPKTGVESEICARRVISFRPSPNLVAQINAEQ